MAGSEAGDGAIEATGELHKLVELASELVGSDDSCASTLAACLCPTDSSFDASGAVWAEQHALRWLWRLPVIAANATRGRQPEPLREHSFWARMGRSAIEIAAQPRVASKGADSGPVLLRECCGDLWAAVHRQGAAALLGMTAAWVRRVVATPVAGRRLAAALPPDVSVAVATLLLRSSPGADGIAGPASAGGVAGSWSWRQGAAVLACVLGPAASLPAALRYRLCHGLLLAPPRPGLPLQAQAALLAFGGHFPVDGRPTSRPAASSAGATDEARGCPLPLPLAELVARWEGAAPDPGQGSHGVDSGSHRALTAALLLSLGCCRPSSDSASPLGATSPLTARLLTAVSSRLGHADPLSRACGFRVAEAFTAVSSPGSPVVFPGALPGGAVTAAELGEDYTPGVLCWYAQTLDRDTVHPMRLQEPASDLAVAGALRGLEAWAAAASTGAGEARPEASAGSVGGAGQPPPSAQTPPPATPLGAELATAGDPDEVVGDWIVTRLAGAGEAGAGTDAGSASGGGVGVAWLELPLLAGSTNPAPASFLAEPQPAQQPPSGERDELLSLLLPGGALPRRAVRLCRVSPGEACRALGEDGAGMVGRLTARSELGRAAATKAPAPAPEYLRDAVESLRGQSCGAPEFMAALRCIPRLVRRLAAAAASRHELVETAQAAASTVLHASDRFGLAGFPAARADALLALVRHAPALTVPVLSSTVFAPEQTLAVRVDAVSLLADAALDMAGLAATAAARVRGSPTARGGKRRTGAPEDAARDTRARAAPRERRLRLGHRLGRAEAPAVSARSDRFGPVAPRFIVPLLAGLEATLRPTVLRGAAGVTDPWGEDTLLLVTILRCVATMLECARLAPSVVELATRAWRACAPALRNADAGVRAAAAAVAAAVIAREQEQPAPSDSETALQAVLQAAPELPLQLGVTAAGKAVVTRGHRAAGTEQALFLVQAAREAAGWAVAALQGDPDETVRRQARIVASLVR